MKLWLMNPRMIERRRPGLPPEVQGTVVCVVDCPCGVCGVPVTLPNIDAVTWPALGETLTQLQWRQLLNDYTLPDEFHRIMPSVNCQWIATCRNGRLRRINYLDGTEGAEDDESIREDPERIRDLIERRRNGELGQGAVRIRGR